MRERQNDPSVLNKGDPNKQWCHETIEQVFFFGKMDDFRKAPKKSYEIENYDLNQLDFPISHMMFFFCTV